MTTLVWLLIALPAAGAAILLLAGKRSNGWGHLLGCAAAIASFAVGVVLFVDMLGRDAEHRVIHQSIVLVGAGRRAAGGLRASAGPVVDVLRAADHRGRLADPRLLDRLYGRRSRAAPVFRVHEPVLGRDAAAGAGRQLPRAVRRLGGRRFGVLSADRLLVLQTLRGHRRQEGVRGEPGRRRRSGHRDDGHVHLHRLDFVRRCFHGRTRTG